MRVGVHVEEEENSLHVNTGVAGVRVRVAKLDNDGQAYDPGKS